MYGMLQGLMILHCCHVFIKKCMKVKLKLEYLAISPERILPNQYTAIRYLSIVKREELNIFYHPVSTETNKFVNNPFDVLIDMNFKKLLPLQYISSLSNAGLKVGLFESEVRNPPFDLMMDLKKPVNVEDYLNHVLFYLEMINSGTVN